MKRWVNKPVFSVVNNHIIDYPTPLNISYFWGFGFLSGLMLAIQIITGVFLAIHYTPHVDMAFTSVEHIMRDVNNGWFIRYLHCNGASFFFIVVYTHIFRGLYYGSYLHPRELLWCSGVLIFLLIIATAFIGYVLPWGQISFWGATVITNLFSAIPFIGQPFVEWVWGGFSVDNPTLNRFFSLHYVLPFAILALVMVHLVLLHQDGSNNPLGIPGHKIIISFYPYFYVKDLFGVLLLMLAFSYFVFFSPNTLGHPDNYIRANPITTPAHIVPEWYFLPFYAILRSIPNKLGGVLAMFGSIVVLFMLPFINSSEIRSSSFRPLFRKFFWFFVVNCFILGWIGQNVVEYPFVEVGQFCTCFYFFFLLVLIPLLGRLENYLMRLSFLRRHSLMAEQKNHNLFAEVQFLLSLIGMLRSGSAFALGAKCREFESYHSEYNTAFLTMELILFFFFSMNTLACCSFVAFLSTPVNAVFYLVLAFCNAAGLLIIVETEFLALLFLIVYVGAIAVLFLFVIIILNLKEPVSANSAFLLKETDKENVVIFSFIFVILFFQALSLFSLDFVSLQKSVDFSPARYTEWVFYLDFFPNIELFGQLVYTYFFFYFLVAGFILLVAMVSSVVLTSQKKSNNKRQLVVSQLARTGNFSVFLVSRISANNNARV